MSSFETCEAEHGWEGCAHRFESYDPKYESVFYHADQLIKTMYATFLEGWLSMFGSEHVLWGVYFQRCVQGFLALVELFIRTIYTLSTMHCTY